MNSFVRFVLVLVIAGVAINLAIVLAGNRIGERRQREMETAERTRLAEHYALLVEKVGEIRAHVLVESQEVSGDNILNTKLLVSEYRYERGPKGQYVKDSAGRIVPKPLSIRHVTIPGGEMQIDAVAVSFHDDITTEFRFLGGKKLYILSNIRAPEDDAGKAWTELFELGQVPAVVRYANWQASRIEKRLWQYIAEAVAAKRDGDKQQLDRHPGVEMTTPKSARRPLAQGQLYMLTVDQNGVTILPVTDSGVASDMRKAATQPSQY